MEALELAQRVTQALIEEGVIQPEDQTWNTDQFREDFTLVGFAAPCVVVRRKSDGQLGTLFFRHSPRIYWGFVPDRG